MTNIQACGRVATLRSNLICSHKSESKAFARGMRLDAGRLTTALGNLEPRQIHPRQTRSAAAVGVDGKAARF